VRWAVEAANHRIKQIKYFANTIQNFSLIYLESDLSIACALINRYQPPIAVSKSEDAEIILQNIFHDLFHVTIYTLKKRCFTELQKKFWICLKLSKSVESLKKRIKLSTKPFLSSVQQKKVS
jgi:hypothetical protein